MQMNNTYHTVQWNFMKYWQNMYILINIYMGTKLSSWNLYNNNNEQSIGGWMGGKAVSIWIYI